MKLLTRPVVICDMDNVAVRFEDGVYRDLSLNYPHVELPAMNERLDYYLDKEVLPEHRCHVRSVMNRPGFFRSLEPMHGAKAALNEMLELGWDVRIATVPLFTNPTCADDKYAWMEKEIGPGWANRTIITNDKGYVRGDIIIDDKSRIETELDPIWEHVLFDQPYNRTVVTRHRLSGWTNWYDTIYPILSAIQSKP